MPVGAKFPSIKVKPGFTVSFSIALLIESNALVKYLNLKISSTDAMPIAK